MPAASHARTADSARRAESAAVAGLADEAQRLNGRRAACAADAREFAGACWETDYSSTAVSPSTAASACAARGGELPSPLALAAFTKETGLALAAGGEWTGDIIEITGADKFALAVVTPDGKVSAAGVTDEPLRFRCVTPLVS